MKNLRRWSCLLLAVLLAVSLLGGCGPARSAAETQEENTDLVLFTAPPTGEHAGDEDPSESIELPILTEPPSAEPSATAVPVAEDGSYTSKDDVALYLHLYGHLPDNFITKKEAQTLGWTNGPLEDFAPGKCIGGDYFGNYEGLLPSAKGRSYHECDIDTLGQSRRGVKRIVYSNDGLIYYTDDHYESFTLLYGEE